MDPSSGDPYVRHGAARLQRSALGPVLTEPRTLLGGCAEKIWIHGDFGSRRQAATSYFLPQQLALSFPSGARDALYHAGGAKIHYGILRVLLGGILELGVTYGIGRAVGSAGA